MRLAITNKKGGVGKTTIAKALAIHYQTGIVTNEPGTNYQTGFDDNDIFEISEGEAFPVMPHTIDIVYDLGGGLDQRLADLLPDVDVVIIPLRFGGAMNDWEKTCQWIEEVEKFNDKIIVIINDTINQKPKKLYRDTIEEAFTELYPNIPYVILPPSDAILDMHNSGIGLLQLADSVPKGQRGLMKYNNRKIVEGFTKLITLCDEIGANQ
jgi:hypothetical protein